MPSAHPPAWPEHPSLRRVAAARAIAGAALLALSLLAAGAAAGAAGTAAAAGAATAPDLGLAPLDGALATAEVVDLTHAFDERTPYWPNSPSSFTLETLHDGPTAGGWHYSAFRFCAPEHGGTHLDAPRHFAAGTRTAEAIPVGQLVAPAVVIDVSAAAARDPDYRLSAEDVVAWEARHGAIPRGAIVLLATGWSARYPDRKAYFGDDRPGRTDALHFPSFGVAGAEALLARGAGALGVDTPSIDHGPSPDFPVHRLAAAREVPGLENLANLDRLPARGAWIVALPMKIAGGSGGPLRAIALVPPAAATATRPLTPPPAGRRIEARAPAWSPDSAWIAFESNRSGRWALWRVRPNGSGLDQMTRSAGNDRYPAWTPDGRELVFQSDRDGSADLYAIDLSDGAVRRLTRDEAPELHPAVSPDGARIAFARDDGNGGELRLLDRRTGQQIAVTPPSASSLWPRFDPTGTHLAFFSRRDTGGADDEIYVVELASRALRRVTDRAGHDFCPSFGPSGDRLVAAISSPEGVRRIEILSLSGRTLARFAEGFTRATEPAWSPDGRWIAFAGQATSESDLEIHVLEIATGRIGSVTPGS